MKNEKIVHFLHWYMNTANKIAISRKVSLTRTLILVGFLICAALLLSSLHGCSSDTESPLDSLASSSLSKTFDLNYWMAEGSQNTDLWKQAVVYCQPPHALNVNCISVHKVAGIVNAKKYTSV